MINYDDLIKHYRHQATNRIDYGGFFTRTADALESLTQPVGGDAGEVVKGLERILVTSRLYKVEFEWITTAIESAIELIQSQEAKINRLSARGIEDMKFQIDAMQKRFLSLGYDKNGDPI
jgi:hypothetical protein